MPINLLQPVVVFRKDEEDSGYVVFCPSVEGIFSQEETLEEAREKIRDALEGVIEVALKDDLENYFSTNEYIVKEGEIVETIKIKMKLQVAVSI